MHVLFFMFYPQKLQVGFEISMHVKKKKKKMLMNILEV
jgi:hypothetical protein